MESIRLLLVDDELDFQKSLVERLRIRGIEANGVGEAESALDFMARNQVDVVVLDVKMPGMGGMKALEEMKKLHPNTQVIMLTGHASVESGIQGMKMGAFDYLIKPVKLDQLMEKIKAAFQKTRTGDR